MIVHFPELQRDETFYSGCAQLQDRLPHHNGELLRKELFDIGTKKDITRIPSRLNIFIDRLGDHINLSVREVIEKHTIECEQMYPAAWLTMMRCGQLNARANWIYKAIARGDRDTIKHLLIIRALGYDLQQICKSLEEVAAEPPVDQFSCSTTALTPIKVARRDTHRASLLRILRENPSASRKQLKHSLATAQTGYLARYDRAWLDSVFPAKQRPGPSRGRMQADWARRDREMSEKVPGIRESMLATSQRPKRITRSRLLARLAPRVLPPEKMPLTDLAVKNATESDLEFAIRRLYWFASDTESIGRPLYFSTLLFRAGIRKEWRGLPVVIEAVERAAELFQRTECGMARFVAA